MKSLTTRLAVVMLVLLIGADRAAAEFVNFSYSWSSSGIVLGTNATTGGPGLSTGSVTFALYPDDSSGAELNGAASPIPGALVSTSSSALVESPDSYNSPFSLTLNLKDTLSGDTSPLTFSGSISGTISAFSSALQLAFDHPLTQQVTLGGHLYSVKIDPSSIAIPAPGTAVLLSADISVSGLRLDDPVLETPVSQVPEPSTLVLTGLALPLTAMAWKRVRRKAETQAV